MAEHRDMPGMLNLPKQLSDAQIAQMVHDEFAREPMDCMQAHADLAQCDRRLVRHKAPSFLLCLVATLACALGLYFTLIVSLWAASACLLVGLGCLLTAGIATWRSM